MLLQFEDVGMLTRLANNEIGELDDDATIFVNIFLFLIFCLRFRLKKQGTLQMTSNIDHYWRLSENLLGDFGQIETHQRR